jgi:hypothetical protein
LFSRLPPAFAAVPQYFIHFIVVPRPLSEPDKRISHTSGSSAGHSVFSYPCQVSGHRIVALCIALMFLLPQSTNRGDLRSAGVSRFLARPLRYTGPHHSRRGRPSPSVYIGLGTRVLPLRVIPQGHLARRSPGYLLVVVRLDAVLDPGVSASHSSLSRSPLGLRPE